MEIEKIKKLILSDVEEDNIIGIELLKKHYDHKFPWIEELHRWMNDARFPYWRYFVNGNLRDKWK